MNQAGTLYLIEILHQTTTTIGSRHPRRSCILSKFYIKPQPREDFNGAGACCILSKFYIKPQPDTTQERRDQRCILSKFYIKPQRCWRKWWRLSSCILSKFYIKPQLSYRWPARRSVVSYRNSTSNHNAIARNALAYLVVSYRNSTSNHNCYGWRIKLTLLYLIEILHQTTTHLPPFLALPGCILSKFYIKPQLPLPYGYAIGGCILSKFYIKPQRRAYYF